MKYEKCNVVMLPTKKASHILLNPIQGKLIDCFPRAIKAPVEYPYYQPQHLYITNPNEEIKEGDAVLHNFGMGWGIENPCDVDNLKSNTRFKIIATTDESLTISTYINQGDIVKGDLVVKRKSNTQTSLRGVISLPRPSSEFIKKYCELGGIDEVLVEYEEILQFEKNPEFHGTGIFNEQLPSKQKLKVAPDNTISIKPIKDSWSREEVIELIRLYNAHIINTNDEALGPYQFNHWIKQNL